MVSTKDSRNVSFVCQNPTCWKSLDVADPPPYASGQKVRCSCGSDAKKAYEAPAVRKRRGER
jgi:hypothetical protein